MKKHRALGWIALTMLGATGAAAQNVARSPILDLPVSEMRGEVTKRYDAALQATLAQDVVRANDERYVWASEAKVACGIAIGYLKSNTVHQDSINKCDDFSRRINAQPAPEPVAPQPVAGCAISLPVPIFFDWNVDTPPPEAAKTVSDIAANMGTCGWTSLTVTGHADRSGSDDYNYALSERRARNVANLLSAAGVTMVTVEAKGEAVPIVETADGIREPQNRRVEISAAPRS